jgi:hypothetical protein
LPVEPFVADSARKHEVPEADILYAFNHPLSVIADQDDDDVIMIVGPDRAATLVEVGIVDSDRGPVIIHAFRPARDKYLPR